MKKPETNVLTAVYCKDTPKYLSTAEPAEKRIVHYLHGCFHRKLQEDKRWKVGFCDGKIVMCTTWDVKMTSSKQSCLFSQDRYDLLIHYLEQCKDIIASYIR